jgi:uncharacterized membrane protein
MSFIGDINEIFKTVLNEKTYLGYTMILLIIMVVVFGYCCKYNFEAGKAWSFVSIMVFAGVAFILITQREVRKAIAKRNAIKSGLSSMDL